MTHSHATSQHIPFSTLAHPVWSYLLIGVVALGLRVVDLGGFVNEDEVRYWLVRSQRFLAAMQHGNGADTAISTHPGVTTMWLGSVGILLRQLLVAWGVLDRVDFPTRLALMRLPVVCVHTAILLTSYALLRRLMPQRVAFVAALVWATDPFIVGFSRIVHVDGLAMSFATISVLSSSVYWFLEQHRIRWLVVSAVSAALAILSKSPALVLLPTQIGIALLAWFHMRPTADNNKHAAHTQWWQMTVATMPRLLLWGACSLLTLYVVWPAFWTTPMRVYELLRVGVEVEGGSPHVQGNFFLGHEDNEPGVLFYPVAVALRLTPWAMIGLFAVPWAVRRQTAIHNQHNATAAPPHTYHTVVALVIFALLFIAGMSIFPKKLNRYLIPAFPAIDIVAAYGIVWLIIQTNRTKIYQACRVCSDAVLVSLLVVLAVANAVWYHPYGVVYFNQLLGGHRTAAHTFLIGAGEGLEQVAAWLNQQPDITGVVTLATMPPPLQPYLQHGAFAGYPNGSTLPPKSGYVVIYVRNVWGHALPPFDQFYQRVMPVHTVQLHGVTYAWIYQVPQQLPQRSDALFGDSVALHSYAIDLSAIRHSGVLSLTLQWHVQQPLPEPYMLFVHVFDEHGQRVSQIDVPPAPHRPTTTWYRYGYVSWVHPVPLPPTLPAGTYVIAVGLYHPTSFARLPIILTRPNNDTSNHTPDDGDNVVFLRPFHVE